AVGSPDAPVVLIEYSDFQCPFCGRFARETKPDLIRDYVDKGVLRMEWRNFPVFGAESEQAARAGWAAGRQDRFWRFHDEAYGEPRRRNAGDFSTAKLLAMARTAGVEDLARFEKDMASDAAHRAVTRDSDEGYGRGVAGTPAALAHGRPGPGRRWRAPRTVREGHGPRRRPPGRHPGQRRGLRHRGHQHPRVPDQRPAGPRRPAHGRLHRHHRRGRRTGTAEGGRGRR